MLSEWENEAGLIALMHPHDQEEHLRKVEKKSRNSRYHYDLIQATIRTLRDLTKPLPRILSDWQADHAAGSRTRPPGWPRNKKWARDQDIVRVALLLERKGLQLTRDKSLGAMYSCEGGSALDAACIAYFNVTGNESVTYNNALNLLYKTQEISRFWKEWKSTDATSTPSSGPRKVRIILPPRPNRGTSEMPNHQEKEKE